MNSRFPEAIESKSNGPSIHPVTCDMMNMRRGVIFASGGKVYYNTLHGRFPALRESWPGPKNCGPTSAGAPARRRGRSSDPLALISAALSADGAPALAGCEAF